MKATFFSSDFVFDDNGDIRLLEVNTDTVVPQSNLELIDYSGLVEVLSQNNITKFTVIYKPYLHKPFVDNLSTFLTNNAPFITSFNHVTESPYTIYPTFVADAQDTFILRLAYDESAIFDSEYAKSSINLLKLFSESNNGNLVPEFYHSSSLYGYHNTINPSTNQGNVPDYVVKTAVVDQNFASFYKVGSSGNNLIRTYETDEDRVNNFINQVATSDNIVQKYHFNEQSIVDGRVVNLRVFSILYGPELNRLDLLQYKAIATLQLPTELNYNPATYVNELDSKHYYEFATNLVKDSLGSTNQEGILETHTVVKADGTEVELKDIAVGDTVKSYQISGSLFDENIDHWTDWKLEGSTLPVGSYLTSSVLVSKNVRPLVNKTLSNITLNNDTDFSLFVSPAKSFLVYNDTDNFISWKRASHIKPMNDHFIAIDGTLTQITSNDIYITNDDNLNLIGIDVEDTDTYILGGTTPINSFSVGIVLAHNCFVKGTKILMEGEIEKNVEDVQVGDSVISFNESTKMYEHKVVTATKQTLQKDFVTYVLDNGKELTCTLDHPIYTDKYSIGSYSPEKTNELVKSEHYNINQTVEKLNVGDNVIDYLGNKIKILDIKENTVDNLETFIFTVESNNNFFANSVLVHNKL